MYGIKTAADATEMLQNQINNLGEAAGHAWASPFGNIDFADLSGKIAYWRGVAETLTAYERFVTGMAERGISGPQAIFSKMSFLASRAAYGGDDTWSGRGNVERRRHFDGVRETIRDLIYEVDAEAAEAFKPE